MSINTLNRIFFTILSQNFCNILVVPVSLWHVYHMTKAVQAMDGTYCGW